MPDAQAVYGARPRASGSTLRSAQQAFGVRSYSRSPCCASCCATVSSGSIVRTVTS
jgi:hypothetical protein